MKDELALVPKEPQAVAPAQSPAPAEMMRAITEGRITNENVAAFEKLLDLQWKMEQRNAEKEFNAAFVKLQSELPTIVASSVIPNRGKYERFEDVMRQIAPALTANGFSVSFDQDVSDSRMSVVCHLKHIGGHSVSNKFAVRVGRKADSDTQADCMAATTAKRTALLQALNIVIRQDCLDEEHDARMQGGCVTPDVAFELERRVGETNSDKTAFLKFAGAKTFSEIPASRYDDLDAMLRRKEQRR